MNTNSEHLKVECAENCGNAPKKQLLKEWTIALAEKNIDFCLDCMRDDIVWNVVGQSKLEGKEKYEKAIKEIRWEVKKLTIENIITHGNTASVNGIFILEDKKQIAFCDVYKFGGFGKNAKIKEITSYVIPLPA